MITPIHAIIIIHHVVKDQLLPYFKPTPPEGGEREGEGDRTRMGRQPLDVFKPVVSTWYGKATTPTTSLSHSLTSFRLYRFVPRKGWPPPF